MWLSDGYGAHHNKASLQVRQCMCLFVLSDKTLMKSSKSVLWPISLLQFSNAKRVKFIWWVLLLSSCLRCFEQN